MSDRLATLQGWVEESPDDAFSRYALAMEYKKHEHFDKALGEFAELTKRNEDYHATYYHYGALLVQLGRRDEARGILEKGLEVTKRLGEQHANDELTEALAKLDE